ncbi:MAG: hypothetical protein H0W33_04915 [Gammaproteobacteria bacterium]|nr:hypothetical protein [Gammaproteobacteria bacterium]
MQTPDVLASVEFYESLGFRQCVVGETWSHPYAVLSDGRLFLGLHDYAFDSPALTFVRPELSAHLAELERRGLRFQFRKTGEEVFNEAGFLDPDGHMIALLEARTFSPAGFPDRDFSALGRFGEYSLPVRDLDVALDFWRKLEGVPLARDSEPRPRASVNIGGARLGLHQKPDFRQLSLTFLADDMAARIEYLREKGYELTAATLRSPEGLTILLRESKSKGGVPETD